MNARLFIQIGGSSPSDPLRLIWRASRQTCLVLRTRGLATGTSKPTASWLSVERESVDCTREPWKRRIECVVHFPTLFRVVPIHSLVYFSLCENAISLFLLSRLSSRDYPIQRNSRPITEQNEGGSSFQLGRSARCGEHRQARIHYPSCGDHRRAPAVGDPEGPCTRWPA